MRNLAGRARGSLSLFLTVGLHRLSGSQFSHATAGRITIGRRDAKENVRQADASERVPEDCQCPRCKVIRLSDDHDGGWRV